MVMTYSYPLCPTPIVLQILDPAFTLDPSIGQPFHGLYCVSACVLPIPVHFLLPCISHILLHHHPYTSQHFSTLAACWNLLGSFYGIGDWVILLPEILILLVWGTRT